VRIEHAYQGNGPTCSRCACARKAHRGAREREYKRQPTTFFGLDGEGQTDRLAQTNGVGGYPGKHRYIMLCASDESGREYVVRNPKGLKTRQCLDFFLSLPTRNSKFFAYSFGYDLTKILEDIDDHILYRLIRPELRRVVRGGRKVLAPIYWPAKAPKYALNWMNGRFSIKGLEGRLQSLTPRRRPNYQVQVGSRGRHQ